MIGSNINFVIGPVLLDLIDLIGSVSLNLIGSQRHTYKKILPHMWTFIKWYPLAQISICKSYNF